MNNDHSLWTKYHGFYINRYSICVLVGITISIILLYYTILIYYHIVQIYMWFQGTIDIWLNYNTV